MGISNNTRVKAPIAGAVGVDALAIDVGVLLITPGAYTLKKIYKKTTLC